LAVDIDGTRLSGLQRIAAVPDAHRATLSTEAVSLTCPNNTLADFGVCIVPVGANSLTLVQATDACQQQGMRLCSSSEVASANYLDFGLCAWGWVSDYINPTDARRVLASNGTDTVNCGATGLNPTVDVRSATWAGLCCR